MSSARRSWREVREDRRAASVRTPADLARFAEEAKRGQRELIARALELGRITEAQADEMRGRFGL